MENTKKEDSIGNLNKFYGSIVFIFSLMLLVVLQPFPAANATVTDGSGNNTLT